MSLILRENTAVDVLIGPFLDITDAATGEVGETPVVELSKNGQTLTAKNDVTTPVFDDEGYHNCELNATDTGTVGTLVLIVAASGTALPVRHEYQVITQAAYDALYASSAVGPVTPSGGPTITLPGKEAPPNAPTWEEFAGWLYKSFRNKKTQSTSLWALYDNAGSTVDAEATVSDAAGVGTKGEVVTGT